MASPDGFIARRVCEAKLPLGGSASMSLTALNWPLRGCEAAWTTGVSPEKPRKATNAVPAPSNAIEGSAPAVPGPEIGTGSWKLDLDDRTAPSTIDERQAATALSSASTATSRY